MDRRFKIILTFLVLAAMLVVFLVIPMFMVKRQKTLEAGVRPKSPYQVAYGEGDIYQRGVSGDGEGGGGQEGKEKKRANIYLPISEG